MHLGPASSIPSLEHPGLSVRDETLAFNTENPAHSQARLVDRNRFKLDVSRWDFPGATGSSCCGSRRPREETLGNSRITDWLSPQILRVQFLVHVADHLRLPALAQRGRAEALSASLHEASSRASRRSPASSAPSTTSMTRSCGRLPAGLKGRACNSCATPRSPTWRSRARTDACGCASSSRPRRPHRQCPARGRRPRVLSERLDDGRLEPGLDDRAGSAPDQVRQPGLGAVGTNRAGTSRIRQSVRVQRVDPGILLVVLHRHLPRSALLRRDGGVLRQ